MNHDDAARAGQDGVLAAVAALGDPLRRRIYRFVTGQDHAVSRDEAAEGLEITRSAAAFHLDRLVTEGLLEAVFRRLTGRQGPGAGRPAKLYRRAPREFALSLPQRRYELAARLLAAAVAEASTTGAPVEPVLRRLARDRGIELARSVGAGDSPDWGRAVADVLAAEGYEPRVGEGEIVLANCPFSALVTEQPELVCHMNLAFLEGFGAGLPDARIAVRLEPREHTCCVRLELARA
jgi:predicted ArsR family transcriptional regulator